MIRGSISCILRFILSHMPCHWLLQRTVISGHLPRSQEDLTSKLCLRTAFFFHEAESPEAQKLLALETPARWSDTNKVWTFAARVVVLPSLHPPTMNVDFQPYYLPQSCQGATTLR